VPKVFARRRIRKIDRRRRNRGGPRHRSDMSITIPASTFPKEAPGEAGIVEPRDILMHFGPGSSPPVSSRFAEDEPFQLLSAVRGSHRKE
jgi:hypothetical protein